MLRFEHLPSDFDPLFLFVGDGEDLAALAALLRRFAADPREMSFVDEFSRTASRTALTLAPADGDSGMRDRGGSFCWKLNSWQAARIAERLDLLTPSDNRSGSDIFQVGSEGEIPVKVSKGEFTDEFLVTRR